MCLLYHTASIGLLDSVRLCFPGYETGEALDSWQLEWEIKCIDL